MIKEINSKNPQDGNSGVFGALKSIVGKAGRKITELVPASADELMDKNALLPVATRDSENYGVRLEDVIGANAYDDSEIRGIIEQETYRRVEEDLALQTQINSIESAIDLDVETDTSIASDEDSVELITEYTNIKTGLKSQSNIALPTVSRSTAGTMDSAMFVAFEQYGININEIYSILQGIPRTAVVAGLGSSPSQTALSNAFTAAMGSQPNANDRLVCIDNNTEWIFDNNSTWQFLSSADIDLATETNAGLAKHSALDGCVGYYVAGVGQVNGWSDLKAAVNANAANIASLQSAMDGKAPNSISLIAPAQQAPTDTTAITDTLQNVLQNIWNKLKALYTFWQRPITNPAGVMTWDSNPAMPGNTTLPNFKTALGSMPPSGVAGGDLSGVYPNPLRDGGNVNVNIQYTADNTYGYLNIGQLKYNSNSTQTWTFSYTCGGLNSWNHINNSQTAAMAWHLYNRATPSAYKIKLAGINPGVWAIAQDSSGNLWLRLHKSGSGTAWSACDINIDGQFVPAARNISSMQAAAPSIIGNWVAMDSSDSRLFPGTASQFVKGDGSFGSLPLSIADGGTGVQSLANISAQIGTWYAASFTNLHASMSSVSTFCRYNTALKLAYISVSFTASGTINRDATLFAISAAAAMPQHNIALAFSARDNNSWSNPRGVYMYTSGYAFLKMNNLVNGDQVTITGMWAIA